jgi:NAD(P)-dependent dehydrogenase (short-subunit alcohol dehydrogenase family)
MAERTDTRVAIVTGAGHGIGRETAIQLAARGNSVVVADLNGDHAQAVASEIGQHAFGIGVDVRDRAGIAALVDEAVNRFGGIDILVNNAGIYPNTPFLEMPEAEWDAVFDTNVKGIFNVTQAVAQQMVKQGRGGRVINISSGASVSGRRGASHYCTSKAAVNMLTKVLAIELTPLGITVNAVAPGLIEVPDWDSTEEYVNSIVRGIPAGRIGQPADIARTVVYLAEPGSDFISGSIVFVDGGSGAGRTHLPFSSKSRQAQQS